MKRVAIYSRCSTVNKDQKIEVQVNQLDNYCKSRGWTVSHRICDIGFSGGTDKRPGLKELLELARKRKIDIIIVTKLDRFFRSLNHMVSVLQELTDIGVEFISLGDQIDLSTAAGKLMVHIISAFAEFEKNLIRDRTLAGLEYARKSGKTLG